MEVCGQDRTVQKWLRGGKPSGGSYWGIMQLARGVPGGFELMLYQADEKWGVQSGGAPLPGI